MEENFLEHFFGIISKTVIIIPIVIIVLALVFKFNEKPKKVIKQIYSTITPTITPTKSLSKIEFDLNGPLICSFQNQTASVSAFIKNKQIKLTIKDKVKTQNITVLKDCLYIWEQGKFSGEKICGIVSYLSLLENLPSSANLLNFNQLVNSCKKEEIKDERLFEIPQKVLFKNK